MASKNFSLSKIFSLFTILPVLISFAGNLIHLVESEARLAGRSLAYMLFLALFIGTVVTSIWFCLLGLLLIYLLSLQASWAVSLFIVLLINIIVLIIVGIIILRMKSNLSFPETRAALKSLKP